MESLQEAGRQSLRKRLRNASKELHIRLSYKKKHAAHWTCLSMLFKSGRAIQRQSEENKRDSPSVDFE